MVNIMVLYFLCTWTMWSECITCCRQRFNKHQLILHTTISQFMLEPTKNGGEQLSTSARRLLSYLQ